MIKMTSLVASALLLTMLATSCEDQLNKDNKTQNTDQNGNSNDDNDDDNDNDGNSTQPPISSKYLLTDLDGSPLAESSKKVVIPSTHPELFEKDNYWSNEFNNASSYINNVWETPTMTMETVNFAPDNVTCDGKDLTIKIKYKEMDAPYGPTTLHQYFQSGIFQSKEKTTYGYYEARIKGSDVWHGTCPAFWLYNIPWKDPVGGANYPYKQTYAEIDIIELQQIYADKHIMATNMHIMVQPTPNTTEFYHPDKIFRNGRFDDTRYYKGQNLCKAPWDSADDYHIYACENRPDSVIWYIDNQRVASIPNHFWHIPMRLTLSMEPRDPFEKWISTGRIPVATTAKEAEAAGFPTTMKVDYVRTYRRKGGYSSFKSNESVYDPKKYPMQID